MLRFLLSLFLIQLPLYVSASQIHAPITNNPDAIQINSEVTGTEIFHQPPFQKELGAVPFVRRIH